MHLPLEPEAAHRAVAGRDTRWDGRLYLGVVTTGIYCRPSCPARTPLPHNCQYFPSAAAAVAAGFRACKRCRPEALPGTRHWDARGDLVGRAVRLIADGALDDGGVNALAARLAVSERHLHRLLVSEVGASPQQLGRTRRAHTARTLIEQTTMPLADVAFAAGFGSIRQFNEVMQAEFGVAPRTLRRPVNAAGVGAGAEVEAGAGAGVGGSAARRAASSGDGREGSGAPTLTLRLAYRGPLAFTALHRTLTAHAIDGVERVEGTRHLRVIDAPSGPAVVSFDLGEIGASFAAEPESGALASEPGLDGFVHDEGTQHLPVTLTLTSLADLMPVVLRVRRLLDLDADPALVTHHLATDAILGPLALARPGLRVPGAIEGSELAVCAVLGQQVSLAVARTFQSRIAAAFGQVVSGLGAISESGEIDLVTTGVGSAASGAPAMRNRSPLRTFPRPEVLAEAGPQAIRDAANLTQARAAAVHNLAVALAGGAGADGLRLEPGSDLLATRSQLLALPGIGPWTADYIALRALRDPDAFMPSDLVLRKAVAKATGRDLKAVTPALAESLSQPWRPWRAYALQHLWTQEVYS